MPLINPIQPTFSGGEFSPSIYPRVDIDKYRTGLKTCRNFIIHPFGGASNRQELNMYPQREIPLSILLSSYRSLFFQKHKSMF